MSPLPGLEYQKCKSCFYCTKTITEYIARNCEWNDEYWCCRFPKWEHIMCPSTHWCGEYKFPPTEG